MMRFLRVVVSGKDWETQIYEQSTCFEYRSWVIGRSRESASKMGAMTSAKREIRL